MNKIELRIIAYNMIENVGIFSAIWSLSIDTFVRRSKIALNLPQDGERRPRREVSCTLQ